MRKEIEFNDLTFILSSSDEVSIYECRPEKNRNYEIFSGYLIDFLTNKDYLLYKYNNIISLRCDKDKIVIYLERGCF